MILLRLINGSGKWKLDSGLKMLIEPIQFWLVAKTLARGVIAIICHEKPFIPCELKFADG